MHQPTVEYLMYVLFVRCMHVISLCGKWNEVYCESEQRHFGVFFRSMSCSGSKTLRWAKCNVPEWRVLICKPAWSIRLPTTDNLSGEACPLRSHSKPPWTISHLIVILRPRSLWSLWVGLGATSWYIWTGKKPMERYAGMSLGIIAINYTARRQNYIYGLKPVSSSGKGLQICWSLEIVYSEWGEMLPTLQMSS